MRVALLGTWDSKGKELSYLRDSLTKRNIRVCSFDLSLRDHTYNVNHTRKQILQLSHSDNSSLSRDDLLSRMASSITTYIKRKNEEEPFNVVIGIGGSCGTSLCLSAMEVLPIASPRKIMFSTIHAESPSDIIWIPSVTDIVINRYNRRFFDAVIGTTIGLLEHDSVNKCHETEPQKALVALTMFGNTSTGACQLQDRLNQTGLCEVVIFHAVGMGGRMMVEGVRHREFQLVIDLTTTELADELCDGIFSAGNVTERIAEITENGVPHIIVPGCLDMVNYRPSNIPEKYKHRNILKWNNQTSLMRTNRIENETLGKWLAESVQNAPGEFVHFVVPTEGFSHSSGREGPFYDPEADRAFIDALDRFNQSRHQITKVNANINDTEFIEVIFTIAMSYLSKLQGAPMISERTVKSSVIVSLPVISDADSSVRAKAMRKLVSEINRGELLIGAGAGNGLSAKCSVQGGASLLICYNSGRFRMAGVGSLAGLLSYSNANAIVKEMAPEILSVVPQGTIVLAGVCATDPFLRGLMLKKWLQELIELGFSGVQNFPTVGLIDGLFRENLEETGMSYRCEVEMIRTAHELGLLTSPYVFCEADVVTMVKAGADIIVIHLGLTASASIGAKTVAFTLQNCSPFIQKLADKAHEIRPDVIVLIHGGPLTNPSDVQYVLQRTTGIAGFYGASSMERLPVEESIPQRIAEFKTCNNK